MTLLPSQRPHSQRPHSRRPRRASTSLLGGALLVACATAGLAGCPLDTDQSVTKGTDFLGDYSFVGTATDDTCLSARYGGAIVFDASLSRTKGEFYFSGPGGSLKGVISGKNFTVTYNGSDTIDTLCTVTREETIAGVLDDTTRSLAGTYIARVLPQQGSNCIGAVYGNQRQFAQLPCAVRYQLTAERTDTPDGGTTPDGGITADGGTTPDGGTIPDGGTPPDGGV